MAAYTLPSSFSISASSRLSGLDMVRHLLDLGWDIEARMLLRQLTVLMPASESPWLQLLALEPTVVDERDYLEGFLRFHPHHPFSPAFAVHLQNLRITSLLRHPECAEQVQVDTPAVSPRVGDFLISRGWTTPQRVDYVLAEQARLRQSKVDQRLGALLLMHGFVTRDQLASALASSLTADNDEFGNYVVRSGLLSPPEVAGALARQAEIAAKQDRIFLDALADYRRNRLASYLRVWKPVPQRKPAPKVGEILVSMGLLRPEQVAMLLEEHSRRAGQGGSR